MGGGALDLLQLDTVGDLPFPKQRWKQRGDEKGRAWEERKEGKEGGETEAGI